jgi:hypothetical protein
LPKSTAATGWQRIHVPGRQMRPDATPLDDIAWPSNGLDQNRIKRISCQRADSSMTASTKQIGRGSTMSDDKSRPTFRIIRIVDFHY